MNKINLYIFDIDGVVADISHRLHYMHEKNYEKFYSDEEIAKDGKIRAGINIVKKLYKSEDSLVMYMTGRPDSTDVATWDWLSEHEALFTHVIFYRDNGDYRPSPVVKTELMQEALDYVRESLHKELGNIYFIDDDPKNVQAVEEKYPDITGIVFTTKRMD